MQAQGDDPGPEQKKGQFNMDYEDFKEQFVEDVKNRLYEQGNEVDLSVHMVNKLNES